MTDDIQHCPPGYYCPESSDAPIKCDIGTYNNEYNAKAVTDCKKCLPGKYCNAQALIEPTGDCEQGYYCKSGAITATPDVEDAGKNYGPCPQGYYCPVSTSTPLPCPAGTFSGIDKAYSIDQCIPCTAGKFCSSQGLAAEEGDCELGFYCPTGSVTSRPEGKGCQPGERCPGAVSSPQKCPAGTY